MPLLGKKLFDPEIESKTEDCNKSFCIPHTKELFQSEIEFQNRLKLYEKHIWTCQCTGHINLTHEEAMKSEKECRERLVRFGEVWEKPLFSLVHQSFSPLDNIVAEAYSMFMTKLMPDEKVTFTVAKARKAFEATVVKGYEAKEEDDQSALSSSGPSKESTSPSSDKENKSRQALITDIFKTDMRRSQRCSTSLPKCDPSAKGKKLKLLPAKYDILLTNENKIVSRVPCEHLQRLNKPPSRELIRLFIRANAVRLFGGREKLPWLVDEIMVFRHSLTPRISSEEEKRMIRISTLTSNEYYKEQAEGTSSPRVNDNLLPNGTVPSEDETISDGKDDKPLSAFLKNKVTIKSNSRKRKSNDSSDKIKRQKSSSKPHLSKGKDVAGKRTQSGMDFYLKKAKKTTDGNSSTNPNTNLSPCIVLSDNDYVSDQASNDCVTVSPSKQSNFKPTDRSSRKSSVPKKKKQATLLELTKKGGVKLLGSPSSKLSKSTPSKPRKPKQPIIVLQLLALKKEKKLRVHKYNQGILTACKTLTEKQRANLPTEIEHEILSKWEFLERKRKFKTMTDEEKRKYLMEQKKLRRKAKKDKFEDQHLVRTGVAKNLPEIGLVSLPESLPNTSFGDVAMLCEFLHSYHTLLSPKDPYFHKQFNVVSVCDAVSAGKTGFGLTRKILELFLRTLLADDIAKDYCEIEYPLNKISVTPEVSCELVRVCLRQHDEEPGDVKSESSSDIDVVETGLQDSTSRRLFDMELYEMEPIEQVEVLSTLAYRVMNTYAVQAHMEDTKVKAASIWNKVAKQKKEIKQEMKEKELAEKKDQEQQADQSVEAKSPDAEQVKESSDLDIDLISRVKKRKMLSEQHRREEEERKERYRKEQDEIIEKQRNEQERERASRQLTETRMLADHVKRRVALGTDRNHSRYWMFCDGVPGLYIEKGWIGDHINYRTMSGGGFDSSPSSPVKSPKKNNTFNLTCDLLKTPTKCPPSNKTTGCSSDEDELPLSRLSTPSKKKPRFRKSRDEATWPKPGLNMWMSVDSQEALDALMKMLLRDGVRESKLLSVLKKNYDNINRSINKRITLYERSTDPPVRRTTLPSDGDELLRAKATKNFQTLIREACRGGLANINEPDVFEQRVAMLENVSEFAAMLLEFFEAIPKTCLLKYMTGVSDKKNKDTDNADAEPPSSRERIRAERHVAQWRQAVEETTLFSRFSLLLAILNNSINWNMYHYRRVYSQRRGTRNRNYADMNVGEDIKEDQVDSEGEEDEDESDISDEDSEEESEEEDDGQRRSSRIQQKKKLTKYKEDEIPATRAGAKRNRKVKFKAETSDEESDEESDMDDDSDDDDDMDDQSSGEEKEDDDDMDMDEEEEAYCCRDIVKKLMKYQYTELFRDPVDEEEVPDYYEIIRKPMCLQKILEKIDLSQDEDLTVVMTRTAEDSVYTFKHLIDDMRLILDNAANYNAQDSYVVKQASKLEAGFIRMCENKLNEDQHDYLASRFKNAVSG